MLCNQVCVLSHWYMFFTTIYYAYFHSVMEYGIFFWGNSLYSKKVLQIWITKGSPSRACKTSFRKLDILSIPSQYIFSVMMFLVSDNTYKSSINQINARKKKLRKPIANFVSYQRSVYYANIRLYKHYQCPLQTK